MPYWVISSVLDYVNDAVYNWNVEQMMETQEIFSDPDHGQKENNATVKEDVFHAVYVPKENIENSQEKLRCVYADKTEALKAIKKFPTARLKSFKNEEDAKKFANYGDEQISPQKETLVHQKVEIVPQAKPAKLSKRSGVVSEESNFKSLKNQELVAFRKLIERGSVEEVKKKIWENPRYLVSSADTPAILQEGCRYNAMHIAVRSAHIDICELILNTIQDPEFLQLLYGKEEQKTNVDRAEMLLDLYLNTPDKGLNETPLHFAVKFGQLEVTKLLVSYSQCEKNLKNKHDQIPLQMICSRKNQEDENIKKGIHVLLEEQFFVPVIRSIDNSLQPTIGQPFSCNSPLQLDDVDPLKSPVEVRALAGPMSKEKAMEFRKKWKTPKRGGPSTPVQNHETENGNVSIHDSSLRLQDPEKGLERVGRFLAEECSVSWKEYWPFLKDFADLQSPEDLMKLENYLKSKYVPFNENCLILDETKVEEKKEVVEEEANRTMDEMNNLCAALEAATLSDSSDDSMEFDNDFHTPMTSPIVTDDDDSEDDMFDADEGTVQFIDGDSATKMDYSVFNALPQNIDPYQFPYVYFWRHEIQIILRSDPNKFTKKTFRRKLDMSPAVKPKVLDYSIEKL